MIRLLTIILKIYQAQTFIMWRIITLICFIALGDQLQATDFYWKGGSGDFNDASKWSLGNPNGPTANQAPISTDNVFFDASTINGGGPVLITFNTSANCSNFWIDPTISSTCPITFMSGITVTLDIYGSFQLSQNINFNFSGVLRFRSIKNGVETITTAGNTFFVDHIEFDGGAATEWLLTDTFAVDDFMQMSNNWDWVIPTGSIMLYNGTLNSNKQTIITDFFYATNNSFTRGIKFDSSTVILKGFNGGDAKGWWIDFDTTVSNFQSFSVSGTELIFDQTNGLKQFGSFGIGLEYDRLYSNNEISISGYTKFKNLETKGSTYFIDPKISVNNLFLSPKDEHFFNCTNLSLNFYLNYYLEIDSFISPTNCKDFITLKGYAKTKGTIRKRTSGTLNLDKVILENMNCDTTGNKSYVLSNSVDDGGNIGGWNFNAVPLKKMKYVGTGNHLWRDPLNWQLWNGTTWIANTTGCVPDPFTDVVVDISSFPPTGARWIAIDSLSSCRDLIWDDATTLGATMRIFADLHIFGDFELGANMNPFQGSQVIYLHGQNNVLKSKGVQLPDITFWKFSDYTIMDDLNAKNVRGWVFSMIRASNININTVIFSLSDRVLNNTQVNLRGTYFDFGGDQISYLGNTTFNFTDTTGMVTIRRQKTYAYSSTVYLPNIYGNGVYLDFDGIQAFILGDLESKGNVRFRVASMKILGTMSNFSGKFKLSPGSFCEIKNLTVADSFLSEGSCNNMITLRPFGGNVGQLEMGASDIEYTFIQGLNNIGPTAQITNCIDGGTNANWSFNSGVGNVYYWRANAQNPQDYEGDWSDPNHWTLNANDLTGTLGGCMPTLSDTVIFDNMSFSGNSNGCNLDNIAYCKTFICLADIRITGEELYVGGSFFLDDNMSNYDQEGVIYFVGDGVNTINLNNTQLRNCGVVFNNPLGEWELQNDFHLHDSVTSCYTGMVLDAGVFRSNGYNITLQSRFRSDRTTAYRVLDIRNSTFDHLCNDRYNSYYGYTWDISNSTGMQILSDNSTINFHNNTTNYSFTKVFYMGNGLNYNDVNFLDNDNFMKVYNNANYSHAYFDGTTRMYGSNSYDSITLIGGHQWFLKTGKIQTLAPEHGKILAYGDGSNFIYIESTVAGQSSYIHKEYGDAFCIDYAKVKDIHATKGPADPVNPSRHSILYFQTGLNSDNINSSATGIWAFVLPPAQNVNMNLPIVSQKICNGGAPVPLPISLTGTYPYVVELVWSNDLGQTGIDTIYLMDDDNDINTPYNTYIDLYPVSNTTYSVQSSGIRCGINSFFSATSNVIISIDSGQLVENQSYGYCDLNNKDEFTHFFDTTTLRPIASVKDKVSPSDVSPLGMVETKAYFDATTQYWNNNPYLKRHWIINSENSGPLKIRLYFTDEEMDSLAYAAYGVPYLDINQDLVLLHFDDTIKMGIPDTIPYSVIPIVGTAAIPFTSASNIYGIEFEVPSLSAFMLTVNDTSVVLSNDMLDFQAEKWDKNNAMLSWQLDPMHDIEFFELERSSDAINFEIIASQYAQLEQYNYHYLDGNPYEATNYYRIKAISIDGSVHYTPIRSVVFESIASDIKLLPNPSDTRFELSFKTEHLRDLIIDIYDMRGVKIHHQIIDGKIGKHQLYTPTQDWVPGMYTIRISDNMGWATHRKLMIQH